MATSTIIALVLEYKYAIFFPLALVEGPFIALLAGFLISAGYFTFAPTFCILIFKDIILDTTYYLIGFFAHQKEFISKYGKRFGLTETREAFMQKAWHEHSWKTILVSKLAYGLSTPFLITAGLVKMPFVKFFTQVIVVSVIQYIIFISIGFYVGDSYPIIASYVHNAQLAVGAIIIIIFLGYYITSKKIKQHILDNKGDI